MVLIVSYFFSEIAERIMYGGIGSAIGGFAGLVGATVLGAPVTVPAAGAAAGLYAGVIFGRWLFVGLMCYLFSCSR